jgi:hypothetical protein
MFIALFFHTDTFLGMDNWIPSRNLVAWSLRTLVGKFAYPILHDF